MKNRNLGHLGESRVGMSRLGWAMCVWRWGGGRDRERREERSCSSHEGKERVQKGQVTKWLG